MSLDKQYEAQPRQTPFIIDARQLTARIIRPGYDLYIRGNNRSRVCEARLAKVSQLSYKSAEAGWNWKIANITIMTDPKVPNFYVTKNTIHNVLPQGSNYYSSDCACLIRCIGTQPERWCGRKTVQIPHGDAIEWPQSSDALAAGHTKYSKYHEGKFQLVPSLVRSSSPD